MFHACSIIIEADATAEEDALQQLTDASLHEVYSLEMPPHSLKSFVGIIPPRRHKLGNSEILVDKDCTLRLRIKAHASVSNKSEQA